MTLSQWEDFWRSGRVVSCPTDAADRYTGNVGRIWERFFADLPGGTRLLDLGTGNGALPLIALEVAQARCVNFEIHGVDLARIDPRRVVPDGARRFADTMFHGGVAAEAMPFADGYFQAVVGQYALEYTRVEDTLRELRRVMASNAPARFVLHHAASIVVETARESLSHACELEENAHAFADLREYVAAERKDPRSAARLQVRMSERMEKVHELAARSKGSRLLADVLPALGNLFESRKHLSAADFAAAFDRTYQRFKAAEQRLRDLLNAALDEPALRCLADRARADGFQEVRFGPISQEEGVLVGWQLDVAAPKSAERPCARHPAGS